MNIDEIVAKALQVRNTLPNLPQNEIDFDPELHIVKPYTTGKGPVKLIIVGQDPTIRNAKQRKKIEYTLNLDKPGSLKAYIETICAALGITMDNIYATNVFKYFYKVPPADTPDVLAAHLQPNLDLLKEELSQYPDCPIITLGEPVLQLLSDKKKDKVRSYWNYKGCGMHYLDSADNKLGRPIHPFPHQPSLRKDHYKNNFPVYLAYMANK